MSVVVEHTPTHEGLQIGRKAFGCQPRHESRQIEGMSADIPRRAAKAGAGGVRPPCGLLALGRLSEPILRIPLVLQQIDSHIFQCFGIEKIPNRTVVFGGVGKSLLRQTVSEIERK